MVEKRKRLSLPEVRRLGIQLCGAIDYLHARDVIHRDLKLGNIFLDEDMNPKIGDFGLAAALMPDKRRVTRCGTPNYMAPEIWTKDGNGHGHEVDLWALGCILFCMITGTLPFFRKGDQAQKEIRRRAEAQEYDWPMPPTGYGYPDEAKDLVAMLLCDEEDRIKPKALVLHAFFTMDARRVPVKLDVKCLTEQPAWKDSVNMKRANLSMTVVDLIKECFTTSGTSSVWTVCEREEVARRGPQLPLKTGALYPHRESVAQPVRKSTSTAPSNWKSLGSIFSSDEETEVLLERTDSALMNLRQTIKTISLSLRKLDPALTPAEGKSQLTDIPRVQIFADHGDKWGVGYVLDDGTTGCILNYVSNSTAVVAKSSIHKIQAFFDKPDSRKRIASGLLLKGCPPIEMYERDLVTNALHFVKIPDFFATYVKRSSEINEQQFEAEKADRLHVWLKFAHWMATRYDVKPPRDRIPTANDYTKPGRPIVVLFQRLGNVVAWAFSDGTLQFTFEADKTHLRFSPNGSYAEFLFRMFPRGGPMYGMKTSHGLFCDTVYTLLQGGSRKQHAENFAENQLESKMRFVYDVLKVWASNGGIGKMGGMKMKWADAKPKFDDQGKKIKERDIFEKVALVNQPKGPTV
jgi:serine/threonine protein kinase